MNILGSFLKGNTEEQKKKRAEKQAKIKKRNEQKRAYRKQRNEKKRAVHKKRHTPDKENIKTEI